MARLATTSGLQSIATKREPLPNYVERTVRSAPGLSQEDALESLQEHPNFKSGTRIASIRRRGDRWVATLHVPKTAAFPPSDDDGPDDGPLKKAPMDDGPDDGPDDAPDGPPMDDGPDGPPKPKSEKGGGDREMVHLLHEILNVLKGGPADMAGPDDMGPGGPPMGPADMPPPPPHGGPGGPSPMGPAGPQGRLGHRRKLKPGEIPNKPGVVPVGAPAFSSTNPLYQRIAKVAGRQRHITVSSPAQMSVKEAKAQLDPVAAHFGYHVAQIRYCGPNCTCAKPGSQKIHAFLSANDS